jgi:hypothetical protein
MFGIEKDFQKLMEQAYGPLGEKQMTKFEGGLEIKNLNSVEAIEAEIKLLQSKLEFYKELEKTKSPVEEAFKDWMGVYPPTNPSVDNIFDIRWRAFQMGYNASKVSEAPQEPEELKTLYQFLGEYKYGVGEDFPNFDDDEFSILDWHQIFIDYLYECCNILDEDDKQITVKINQSQLGGLND